MSTVNVTPSVMRNTAQKLHGDLEHATAITNQYLSTHQNAAVPGIWQGGGSDQSGVTAVEVHDNLNKTITGLTRLTEGLTKAAAIMESNEGDAAHQFAAVFGGGQVQSV